MHSVPLLQSQITALWKWRYTGLLTASDCLSARVNRQIRCIITPEALFDVQTGVISRGLRGSPIVKKTLHFGGFSPLKFLHRRCFSNCIDLPSKVFCIAMMKFSLLCAN